MFDKKKKRSSSLVREIRDELRDTEWPDSVSVTGDEPPIGNGGGMLGGKHDTVGYPGHGRKYSAGRGPGSSGTNGRQQVSDRKTDIEKLYWNGSLAEAEEEAAALLGPGNKRPDISGFNHSATAAFDVIDKTFWNEKNQSFEDQKATEAHVDKVFEQKRKAAAAAAAATHGGQQAMKSYQQQGNSFQNQFGSGEVEKFHWNDKIPGEEEVKSNKQSSSATKMISTGTANQHQPSTRKSKLTGMREFQNFNDEEKLYWNEKLHQFSAVKQQAAASSGLSGSNTDMTKSGKEANGYPTSYQNFLDEKLGWNDRVSDMIANAVPTVSTNGNVKHQQQHLQGMYRSYFQSYEAAAASRWRANEKKQLGGVAGRLAGYCGRPASSLGMSGGGGGGGGGMMGSPSIRYNRHRRSSMSYYEENNRTQYNFQGMGRSGGWRSNSMDVLPYVDTEQDSSSTSYPQHAAPAALYPPALAQLSKLSQLAQLQQQHLGKLGTVAANQKLSMMRSNAFETATQFTDQYSSAFSVYPGPGLDNDNNFGCQDTSVVMQDETSSVSVPVVSSAGSSRQRPGSGYNNISSSVASTGASATPPVNDPGPGPGPGGHQLGGSNEDMKKVLMELDNTGYFAEVTENNNKVVNQLQQHQQLQPHQHQQQLQQPQVNQPMDQFDYKKLWEDSKLHNVKLQKELNEVKTDLESVRCQLETMAIRAVNQKSVSDAEKREKLIVIKKLEGLEKELKLLAYSESLTDQTLDQLRLENNRLREENLALLRVMDKIVKN